MKSVNRILEMLENTIVHRESLAKRESIDGKDLLAVLILAIWAKLQVRIQLNGELMKSSNSFQP